MKRDRMRRLSVVSRGNSNEDGEMGCAAAGSDGEDELRSKRFKLPRKFFYDSNTVDHTSVPRKLRSVTKKRNHESISPPSSNKKPDRRITGVELPRKDGRKISRLNHQGDYLQGSPSGPLAGPITKDEEEVVETLYALAEMFPTINSKTGFDGEITNAKYWPLREGDHSKPAFEDSAAPEKEENLKSLYPSNDASLLEESAQETVEVIKCSSGPSQPGFPENVELETELDEAFYHGNVQAMSQSELCLRTSSKQPKREEAAACARNPEIEAAAVRGQHELQYILKESTNTGTADWTSAGLSSIGNSRPSLMPSRDVIPTWLNTAVSATPPGSSDNGPCTKRESKGSVARKKSWKRCSAHVYISRLIKVLQIAEKSDTLPTQLTSNEEEPKQGVCSTTENRNGESNGMNETFSSLHSIVSSAAAAKNTNKVSNGNLLVNGSLLHKRLPLDQQQASTTSPLYTSQKQSFDFLSLSAGGAGFESPNSTSKLGNRLDPLAQFHIPYQFMPFSVSENCFSSTPSAYNLPRDAAKQVHITPLPYVGNSLACSPQLGTTALPKQQQQQRWIWTSQLAAAAAEAQQNPVGSHIPHWQNGRRQEYPSSALQYAQSQSQFRSPPLFSSQEVLAPKYASISQPQQQQQQQLQQQQQFIAVTSSPLPVAQPRKQQQHHLPAGYNVNGVGSYADAAARQLHLQLLCDDYL